METQTVALEAITNLKEKPQDQQELSNVTYKQQIQQHHQGHQNNQQKFLKNTKQQQNHHPQFLNQTQQQQLQIEREQQQQQKLHKSKTIFVTNLHQCVTVNDLYELFGLRSRNYLRNNCHIEMDHFSNVDQPFASATVTAPAHVCEEILKLQGIDFHDNPLVIDMSKCPLEQSNHYFQPPLQPPPIQRVIHSYENAVKPKRKDIALFTDSIPKGTRMKDLNSRVKGGKYT